MSNRLLRPGEVCERLGGIGRSTFCRLVRSGAFPPAVIVTPGRTGIHGWPESVVDAWIQSRVAAPQVSGQAADSSPVTQPALVDTAVIMTRDDSTSSEGRLGMGLQV